MKRRLFLQAGLAAGVAAASSGSVVAETSAEAPTNLGNPFKQPPLPYALNALDPFLSAEQMNYHYNKHHAGYYANLKKLIEGKPEAELTLEEIIRRAGPGAVFNNAAQAWNHAFFWNCMTPPGTAKAPREKLLKAVEANFGDFDKFKDEFIVKATAVFGSGWCWLTENKDGKLEIMQASNADCPLQHGKTPLLVVDVWEHAYYVDYRNERARFLKAFMDHVDWEYVAANHF